MFEQMRLSFDFYACRTHLLGDRVDWSLKFGNSWTYWQFSLLCAKKGKLPINPCVSKFQTSFFLFSELREPFLTISSAKWPRCRVLLEGFEEKTKFWIFRYVFPDLPFFQTTNFRYYGEGGMCRCTKSVWKMQISQYTSASGQSIV